MIKKKNVVIIALFKNVGDVCATENSDEVLFIYYLQRCPSEITVLSGEDVSSTFLLRFHQEEYNLLNKCTV